MIITLDVVPVPKPRMTRSDQWQQRPCVLRYRAYCDEVRACWPAGVAFPPAGACVQFHVPMPRSWSQRKRRAHAGQPHQQTPDLDNMIKSLLDALHVDDRHIWQLRAEKRWAQRGSIVVDLKAINYLEENNG